MNTLNRIRLFYLSVYYTSIDKLFYRLFLLIKRNILQIIFVHKKNPFKKKQYIDLKNGVKSIWTDDEIPCFKMKENGFMIKLLNQSYFFDNKFDWHPSYLNEGTRLWKLHLHYFEWIIPSNNNEFLFFVKDWIKKNKPYSKNYWMDSWNSYAISIRIVVWIKEVAKRKSSLNKSDLNIIYQSIYQQTAFLIKNLELDIGGNHIIKNIKALYFSGNYLKVNNSKKWIKTADSLLKKELDKQILKDGFHFELSPSYHCQVFEDLLECHNLIHNKELKKMLEEKIDQMIKVVESFTHPDNKISLFNDGGLEMARAPKSLLKAYYQMFPNKKSGKFKTSFEHAGYYVMKNKLYHLIYDSGTVGPDELPAHSHGDIFSFELSINKQRVIVDQGVFEYNNTPKRKTSRSTLAHNTVSIDGFDQCEFWSSFRMALRAKIKINKFYNNEQEFFMDSSHDGFSRLNGKPIHNRIINCKKDNILIKDKVISNNLHNIRSSLLIHPNIEVFEEKNSDIILIGNDFSLKISSTNSKIKIEKAVWWPNFGQEMETHRINFDFPKSVIENDIKLKIENR